MANKILMVCLGNICRSPLAEGILRSKLSTNSFYIDSAGTANYHTGSPPDPRSIAIAKAHGIDISKQQARQFTVNDFDNFDCIYAMDNSNFRNITALSRNENDRKKVKLILNEITPNQDQDVPDPYYGGEQGFKNVYNMLDDACENIVSKLT